MSGIEPGWLWLIGGVVLLIAEVIAPGFFLIFIGAAAIATGLFTLLFGLGTVPQLGVVRDPRVPRRACWRTTLLCFALRLQRRSPPQRSRRAARSARVVTVVVSRSTPMAAGSASATANGSARGGPAAIGERVRIVDVDGNCLKVEAEHVLPPA